METLPRLHEEVMRNRGSQVGKRSLLAFSLDIPLDGRFDGFREEEKQHVSASVSHTRKYR